MIVFAADPWHSWHQAQLHMFRSAAGAEELLGLQYPGTFVAPLIVVMEGFKGRANVQAVGVDITRSVLNRKKGSDAEYAFAAQAAGNDSICSHYFGFAVSLVGACMRRCLNFLYGFPFRVVLLVFGNSRQQAIADLKQAWEDHEDFE